MYDNSDKIMNIEKVKIIFHVITILTPLMEDNSIFFPSAQAEKLLVHSSDKV